MRQPSSGPIRTGLQTSTQRLKPYGTPHARANEHIHADVGPLTLASLYTPYVDLPTLQPTGGWTPEKTANAEKKPPEYRRKWSLGKPLLPFSSPSCN